MTMSPLTVCGVRSVSLKSLASSGPVGTRWPQCGAGVCTQTLGQSSHPRAPPSSPLMSIALPAGGATVKRQPATMTKPTTQTRVQAIGSSLSWSGSGDVAVGAHRHQDAHVAFGGAAGVLVGLAAAAAAQRRLAPRVGGTVTVGA